MNTAEHVGSAWKDLLQVIMAPQSSSFGLWVWSFSQAWGHTNALACSIYSCPLIYQPAEHSRKENAINLGDSFFFLVNSTGSSLETAAGMWFLGTKAVVLLFATDSFSHTISRLVESPHNMSILTSLICHPRLPLKALSQGLPAFGGRLGSSK